MRRDIFERLIGSNRNLLVNGDISSGKTSNIIFPIIDRIIDNEENFLFLDSKEEYINKYYGLLKSKDYNITIINLQELDRSFGWNPLEYPYLLYKNNEKDRAIEFLECIANTIFYENNNESSFWVQSACDLFVGICLILFEDAKKAEINISSINSIINNKDGYLKKYLEQKDEKSTIYTCLSGTILAPADTRGGIITTFKQQLRRIISKDKLNNLLYKTTFDINTVTKERNAIFIMNRDDNKDINIVSTLLIEQIFKIVFNAIQHPKYNFILDNIDTVNHINNLSNMLSSGIARNIKFAICTRSLDDFNKNYGEYVDKLCNIININNKNIEVELDNKYEKIRYFIGATPFPKDTINYPIITKNDIEIFNFSEFIANNVKKEIKENLVNNDKKETETKEILGGKNPFINEQDDNIFSIYEDNKPTKKSNRKEIDELINKIDNKLKELNEELGEDDSNDIEEASKEENPNNIDINDEKDNNESSDNLQKIEEKIKEITVKTDKIVIKADFQKKKEIKDDYQTELQKRINEKITKLENKTSNTIDDNPNIDEEEKEYVFENSTDELLKQIDEKIAELERETLEKSQKKKQENKFNSDIFPSIHEEMIIELEEKPKHIKNKLNHPNKQIDIEEEIETELEELGFIKTIDGKKYHMNGYNQKKQELLKEKYNLSSNNNSIF
ncbi:MAG: type IV secretion system DNA-binding domain-containing protein [Bacilli bacterium]|nr:type IV secretion system DNA-binding domain-containing protein [Bacilli bacterium]